MTLVKKDVFTNMPHGHLHVLRACSNCTPSRAALHNTLPAGGMRLAKAFHAACESFLTCRKCCQSSTSNN